MEGSLGVEEVGVKRHYGGVTSSSGGDGRGGGEASGGGGKLKRATPGENSVLHSLKGIWPQRLDQHANNKAGTVPTQVRSQFGGGFGNPHLGRSSANGGGSGGGGSGGGTPLQGGRAQTSNARLRSPVHGGPTNLEATRMSVSGRDAGVAWDKTRGGAGGGRGGVSGGGDDVSPGGGINRGGSRKFWPARGGDSIVYTRELSLLHTQRHHHPEARPDDVLRAFPTMPMRHQSAPSLEPSLSSVAGSSTYGGGSNAGSGGGGKLRGEVSFLSDRPGNGFLPRSPAASTSPGVRLRMGLPHPAFPAAPGGPTGEPPQCSRRWPKLPVPLYPEPDFKGGAGAAWGWRPGGVGEGKGTGAGDTPLLTASTLNPKSHSPNT
jgi:hypothetical protein